MKPCEVNKALMRGREYQVVSHRVLSLATASTCSAYDCEFVALAQDLGVPLVTADRQILQEFGDVAVPLGDFVSPVRQERPGRSPRR